MARLVSVVRTVLRCGKSDFFSPPQSRELARTFFEKRGFGVRPQILNPGAIKKASSAGESIASLSDPSGATTNNWIKHNWWRGTMETLGV